MGFAPKYFGMGFASSLKGRTRNILEALYTWVGEVLSRHYLSYYVTMNYRFNIVHNSTMPLVTIRIDPITIEDVTYGRRLPASGSLGDYIFTIHIYEKYNTGTSEVYNEDAQTCARRVMEWLEHKNNDAEDMNAYGVWAIRDVGGRESDPRIRNVARIIVSGTINVKREDNP